MLRVDGCGVVHFVPSVAWGEMSSLKAVCERLARLNDELADTSLWALFTAHPDRVAALSRHLVLGDDEVLLDLSKQHVTGDVLSALVDLAAAAGVAERRDAMYRGDVVNESENRPALHVALRSTSPDLGVSREHAERARREMTRLCEFADSVRAGALGDVRTVVNVGIGGSELGPATLYEGLCADADPAISVRWLANVDPYEFHREVRDLDPATTLVIVCSKTFTTAETLSNARFAARWLGDHAARRLVAVTAHTDAARSSGLPFVEVFEFWEWVGGRYSVAGAPSLAVAVAHSGATLLRVLDGMQSMDRHFATAPLAENLPVLLGALEWWNVVVRGHGSRAVVVYSSALRRLPEHLAQLEMESTGKSVDRNGAPLVARTPVTWGGVGTSVQHAFFQALHQGVEMPPTEFVGFSQVARVVTGDPRARDAHDTLVSNMFAQSRALAFGSHLAGSATDPHRAMPGNRPSTTLLVSRCSPEAIGALLALYEHATFVRGVLWGMNTFDQWGVELGKSIAKDVAASFVQGDAGALDSSSAMLVDTHRRWRTSS